MGFVGLMIVLLGVAVVWILGIEGKSIDQAINSIGGTFISPNAPPSGAGTR